MLLLDTHTLPNQHRLSPRDDRNPSLIARYSYTFENLSALTDTSDNMEAAKSAVQQVADKVKEVVVGTEAPAKPAAAAAAKKKKGEKKAKKKDGDASAEGPLEVRISPTMLLAKLN